MQIFLCVCVLAASDEQLYFITKSRTLSAILALEEMWQQAEGQVVLSAAPEGIMSFL